METKNFKEFAARFDVSQHSQPLFLIEQITTSESEEAVFKTVPSQRSALLLTTQGRQPGTLPVENAKIVDFQQFGSSVRTGLSIGRATTNKICLADNAISKMHASIKFNIKEEWQIVDVESENGTRINGKPIDANKIIVLNTGDGITFADTFHCTFFTPEGFQSYINTIKI